MRRSLVLTDETACHAFRASLPPHVRQMRNWVAEPSVPWRYQLWNDVRGFAQAYCACLLAISVFLA